jgi:hypothetical protein
MNQMIYEGLNGLSRAQVAVAVGRERCDQAVDAEYEYARGLPPVDTQLRPARRSSRAVRAT